MENLSSSTNILGDFDFKYIPKKELEELVMRVRRDRKLKDGQWGKFCTVTSVVDSGDEDVDDKAAMKQQGKSKIRSMTDDELHSVVTSVEFPRVVRRSKAKAPFLGPPRKLDIQAIKQLQPSRSSSSESEASKATSYHISETVYEEPPQPNQIQVENHDSSESSSVDDDSSLDNEIIELCSKIESSNGAKSDGKDSSHLPSHDLAYQEEKKRQKKSDKTEKKLASEETYSKFIDKKFDFLYEQSMNSEDECNEVEEAEAVAQTLPAVELKKKSATKPSPATDDCTSDNNVWNPSTENQIKQSGKRREHEKSGGTKRNKDEVFPSDPIICKAREAGKLKHDVNEKSQVDGATDEARKRDKKMPRQEPDADVLQALGRMTDYQKKICQYLDFLREIIDEPPEMDDMNELIKRQKRGVEFSTRFARIHLYQISRLAEEIRLMHDNPVDVATKAKTLFQAIMSAVSSYHKNVDLFIYNSYPDKLLALVDFTISAMKICLDRFVFDERDFMVHHILRRCTGMKKFLLMNQQSMAKFASMKEKARKSLHSRSSFAYENPYQSKSPYGAVPMKPSKTRQAPRQAPRQMPRRMPHQMPRQVPAKSPYDPVMPRNLQSSQSMVTRSSKMPMSKAQSHVKSPIVKRSISNVSTAVQHIEDDAVKENVVTVSEKPCEDLESGQTGDNRKEQQIMEMLQSVAGEKIEKMLTSFLAKLSGEMLQRSPEISEPVQPQHDLPSPRVTSEVEKPQKVKVAESESYEKTQRVAKNVQYLYVKSTDENPKQTVVQLRDEKSSDRLKGGTKILAMKSKPPIPDKSGASTKAEEDRMNQLKQQAMKERMAYIEQMSENPLYGNEAYSQPWKVFGSISDKIVDELLQSVVGELDFGEKDFVEGFLRHELGC